MWNHQTFESLSFKEIWGEKLQDATIFSKSLGSSIFLKICPIYFRTDIWQTSKSIDGDSACLSDGSKFTLEDQLYLFVEPHFTKFSKWKPDYFPKWFISLGICLDIQVYKQISFEICKIDDILVQTSRILKCHTCIEMSKSHSPSNYNHSKINHDSSSLICISSS